MSADAKQAPQGFDWDGDVPPPPGTPAPLDENGNAYRTKWKTVGGPEDGDMVNRPLPPKGGWPATYVPKPGPKRKLTTREMEAIADRMVAKARLQAAREYYKIVSSKDDDKRFKRRAADMTIKDKFLLASVGHIAAAQRTKETVNAPKQLGVVVLPATVSVDEWEARMSAKRNAIDASEVRASLPLAKRGDDGDGNG